MNAEQYDPRFMKPATSCRCGHILECCADCIGWLRDNSPRIQMQWGAWWKLWHEYSEIATPKAHEDQWTANAAERYAIQLYESMR